MDGAFERLLDWFRHARIDLGGIALTPLKLVGVVAVIVGAFWSARALERAIQRVATRRSGDPGAYSGAYALGRVLRYGVWVLGSVWGLQILGINLSSFALLGGAVGIGVGFGLQNIVSNFVAGIILMMERTLKVGDFIDLASGVRGTVREISMRYTRITTNDYVDVLVPNSEFVNGRVTNWTFDEYNRRLRVPFSVAYGSDKTRVREAAIAAARRVPGVFEDESRRFDVWLVGFGDSSLLFELLLWVGPEAIRSPARTQAAALWALDDELRAAGIEIPFPQRDLHVRSGVLEVRTRDSAAA